MLIVAHIFKDAFTNLSKSKAGAHKFFTSRCLNVIATKPRSSRAKFLGNRTHTSMEQEEKYEINTKGLSGYN
jgi:hypothetical protein